MSSEETQPLFGTSSKDPEHVPIYQESHKTKTSKRIVGIFMGVVIFNILLSVILVSVQSARKNGLFVLLLVSLLSFAQAEFFMLFFVYKGHISKGYFWTIFVVGAFVILEAIFTDIIVFTI